MVGLRELTLVVFSWSIKQTSKSFIKQRITEGRMSCVAYAARVWIEKRSLINPEVPLGTIYFVAVRLSKSGRPIARADVLSLVT